MDWDEKEESRFGSFFRIWVLLDVSKPLHLGTRVKVGEKDARWIPLKYKRLANFCYVYGRIDHLLRDCEEGGVEVEENDTQCLPIGIDLRSTFMRPNIVAWTQHDVSFGSLKKLNIMNKESSIVLHVLRDIGDNEGGGPQNVNEEESSITKVAYLENLNLIHSEGPKVSLILDSVERQMLQG